MHSLIVGCGDTGVRVAARAFAAGETVVGIVRSQASAARVRSVGAHAMVVDLDSDVLDLPASDRLFYFAPPPREGQVDTRLCRVLTSLGAQRPGQVVYISTSGVYGDCGGDWANEDRTPAPSTDRARRRLDAESQILAFAPEAIVLRAPGIYGPGRLPLKRIEAGEPIVADDAAGWSNRIHIDDLAALAWDAAGAPWPRQVYNACDGRPTRQGVFYDALADMLGVARVPRISWAQAERTFSPMRLSFLRESRRLDNTRLLEDTGVELAFADYRDGLAASLHAESGRE